MSEKKRIGFVGVGRMGQCAHLRNYATLPGCEVVAVAELREELGRKVAVKYGIPNVYRSHEEMLEKEKLDGIVASQPFSRHGSILPELAKTGIPLFTEKPLASSIEQGEKILHALKDGGSWHKLGYHKRSDPAILYAKRVIEAWKASGECGKLRYVRLLVALGDWIAGGTNAMIETGEPMPSIEWDPPAADMDRETFERYRLFVDYYVHHVNMMRHLMGESFRFVYADPSDIVYVAEGESGVAGLLEICPYESTADWRESYLVAFERGWIRIDLPAPLASERPGEAEVYAESKDGGAPMRYSPTLPWVHAMRQQAIHFIAELRGEKTPLCDATEAMEDLKVARDYIRLRYGV